MAPNQQEASASSSSSTAAVAPAAQDLSLSCEFEHGKNLEQNGFCVLPNILSEEECENAARKVWEFLEDTSNGAVQRETTTIHGSSLKGGIFQSFGAGWLLGEIREALADRVFEPMYGTRELQSSKEGFRLLLGDSQKEESTQIPAGNDPPESKVTVRAMVVLNSSKEQPSLQFNLQPSSSSLSSSSTPTTKYPIQIDAGRGDVIVFRSDLCINESNSSATLKSESWQDVPCLQYCAMEPAIDLKEHKKLWIQKVEAYKERRIGTHRVHWEEWIIPKEEEEERKGRCYFRSSPPLLTRRLAELYGLVPYQSEDWKLEIERAVIKGIRFVEGEDYPALPLAVERPCAAQSTQLTSTDPHITTGQDKYLGGMASPCGKYVYGVPGTARRVMRIRTETGKMDCIGPSYAGKFKWLRGVEIPASVMLNQEEYPDGCCIALSCNHLSFLKINPAKSEKEDGCVYTFGSDVLEAECAGVNGWYYHGGNLASNGWIYCIPANAKRVVKLNPATDEVVAIGPVFEGGQKWYGGLIGSDGCVYGIPHNARNVLKIDPTADEVSVLEGTNRPLPIGNWKWHGGLVAGDKIIGFPNNSDEVLIIDCQRSIVYTTGNSTILQSGRHRIPQDGRYKYLGGALTSDGRFAYFFPCDAERVMRMDCRTDELSLVGPCLLDGENKFQNGFSASDGCLYGIPQRAVGVLRIVPDGKDGKEDHVDIIPCGEDMMSVKDKFEGGVMGYDGCIYCIPLRAKVCVKITPQTT